MIVMVMEKNDVIGVTALAGTTVLIVFQGKLLVKSVKEKVK
jgi:hypothetical protein